MASKKNGEKRGAAWHAAACRGSEVDRVPCCVPSRTPRKPKKNTISHRNSKPYTRPSARRRRPPACAAPGVLLCTDVAARGLDIPDVHWILQLDPPQVRSVRYSFILYSSILYSFVLYFIFVLNSVCLFLPFFPSHSLLPPYGCSWTRRRRAALPAHALLCPLPLFFSPSCPVLPSAQAAQPLCTSWRLQLGLLCSACCAQPAVVSMLCTACCVCTPKSAATELLWASLHLDWGGAGTGESGRPALRRSAEAERAKGIMQSVYLSCRGRQIERCRPRPACRRRRTLRPLCTAWGAPRAWGDPVSSCAPCELHAGSMRAP